MAVPATAARVEKVIASRLPVHDVYF